MIRKITMEDIPECATLMMSVYNNETWQCCWPFGRAADYLSEYLLAKKFVGYVLIEDSILLGAIFCHEKIWWNNNELFVDEMFVLPRMQRKGYGTQLIKAAENYIAENHLAGFTLATNRFSPAPDFYQKNGFSNADHVLFMYKIC